MRTPRALQHEVEPHRAGIVRSVERGASRMLWQNRKPAHRTVLDRRQKGATWTLPYSHLVRVGPGTRAEPVLTRVLTPSGCSLRLLETSDPTTAATRGRRHLSRRLQLTRTEQNAEVKEPEALRAPLALHAAIADALRRRESLQ